MIDCNPSNNAFPIQICRQPQSSMKFVDGRLVVALPDLEDSEPGSVPAQNDYSQDRQCAGKLAQWLLDFAVEHAVVSTQLSPENLYAFLEALSLALLPAPWTVARDEKPVELHIAMDDRQFEATTVRIVHICAAIQSVRQLVATPPNHQLPPDYAIDLAQRSKDLGPKIAGTVNCEVHDERWLEEQKMGLIQAVGKAGAPPRLVHIQYRGTQQALTNVAIVGKGVCFDAGGLDLKSPAGMLKMKYDMAGSAAAFGVLEVCARLNLAVDLDLWLPLVENLVDNNAMKPSDVYTAYDGTTVEITNTDAEGRLIMADALAYATRNGDYDWVVDMATLTGAATATAGWNSIVTGNVPDEIALLEKLSYDTGDKAMRLPLWSEYSAELESDVADTKNSTNTRNAGALSAAAFLQQFVHQTSWLHFDIAPSAWTSRATSYMPKGPSGSGVRVLLRWLETKISAK